MSAGYDFESHSPLMIIKATALTVIFKKKIKGLHETNRKIIFPIWYDGFGKDGITPHYCIQF